MANTVERNASFINPENSLPERPSTPERPPYSPVTPVLSHLAPIPGGAAIIPPGPELSQPQTPWNTAAEIPEYDGGFRQEPFSRPPPMPVRPEPSAVPISESDNPDVIALRSAISVLQLQKQKALKDIKTLDKMKQAAIADPEGFAQELVAGRLSQDQDRFVDTHLPPDDDEKEEVDNVEVQSPEGKFGKIPNPQNIVRMPPINWAKYQVVGEPLDRIHDEQRSRPVPGEPRQSPNQRGPEHLIAAPYRPLTDKLESPTKGRPAKKEKKG
ncbi:hypothetical protein PISL3812_08788 [Talaromyces islandicus]|uniref:Uncharacterized protein n=1 Tax=Talaromyces islandicus TaxID=28573 RepID=A0A0U1M9Z4_TALIS|nr:hypothetical protein PISL3812_08788 [Talaromyces islandicus]